MTNKYKVGYGKPPREHQWKKGQSGNPSGKKGKANKAANAKTFNKCVAEELLNPVTLTVGGKTQKMQLAQVVAKACLHDMHHGSPKEKMLWLKQLKELGVFDEMSALIEDAKDEAESEGLISEDEQQMLDAVYKAVGLGEQDMPT